MAVNKFFKILKSLRLGILVACIVGIVTGILAWYQVQREREIDLEDINRRAHALVYQISFPVREAIARPENETAKVLGSRLEGYGRLIGFAVYQPDGTLIASAQSVSEFAEILNSIVGKVLDTRSEVMEIVRTHSSPVHILAVPVLSDGEVPIGTVVALHDISYVDERVMNRLIHFAFWTLIVTFLIVTLVISATWLAYDRPLRHLAQWMRRLRLENAGDAPPSGLPIALLKSESDRLAASFRAARSAGRTKSRAKVHAERVWTRNRLRAHVIDCLGENCQLIIVSNREPYMHQLNGGRSRIIIPAGGLVTALDPVLKACGGLWVAHGAGDADRENADTSGRLTVPPGDSRYTLRRIWLSREEEQGYYYGFSNEGLWPLCHQAHERPMFRASDWNYYAQTNHHFADAVLEEIGPGKAVVLVHDYHLALLPEILKSSRPDIRVGIFWHVPWPNPEAFRICPWRAEILRGMLGADLIGFHLQQYCNNFLDTVDRMVEARLDWDHFAVELKGHTSLIRPYPISVRSWAERHVASGGDLDLQISELKRQNKLEVVQIAVGVDRIDYTKGMPERFRAIARFLEKYPDHHGKFTFVQLGAPSRTHIRRYREHIAELEALADEINWKFQSAEWKPIRFLVAHHDGPTVYAFMQMASICIVSSLHDGMNLVAKEYVVAQESGDGVLILSEFAGAARELSDAIIINPYDTEHFADAIYHAAEMEAGERKTRMERMRRIVDENNIYRWAANFITDLAATQTLETKTGIMSTENSFPKMH
ncbi:MAG: trehalose-6-phosphate synthase [Gammaproteobacteria bacterium]|nr:trehalose-6-phosphate synthase [Gammaproteobacteria bacterium]